jgi:hypothetical protein
MMAIEVGQIHNLVRTYQRALEGRVEQTHEPQAPAQPETDRLSVSPEARTQAARSSTGGRKA